MSESGSNGTVVVTRFCPECSAKVKALAQKFAQPQKCPGCGKIVLFWDLNVEEIQSKSSLDWIDTRFKSNLLRIGITIASLIAISGLVLFALNFIIVPMLLCIFIAAAGVAGAGYTLAHIADFKHRKQVAANALDAIGELLASHREITQKFFLLKDNLNALVNETKQKLENEHLLKVQELEHKQNRIDELEAAVRKRNGELENSYQQKKKEAIDSAYETVSKLGSEYLDDIEKWLVSRLTTQNLAQSREKYEKTISLFSKVGYSVTSQRVDLFLLKLKGEYETLVRKQLAKEEQARIKERLREEQKVQQEFDREMKRLEMERALTIKLLEEARSRVDAENSERIAELEARLQEAESKQRSLSMAQQTRAGNVYVISNIGSFGEGVYKIGMTRRLEPMDRVRELGDASVPFSFDVHMMIGCENAPKLERELHNRFSRMRMNKVNFRKEFFKVTLEEVVSAVEELHGTVDYVASPDALEYRESITMTDEEFAYIEKTVGADPEAIDDFS